MHGCARQVVGSTPPDPPGLSMEEGGHPRCPFQPKAGPSVGRGDGSTQERAASRLKEASTWARCPAWDALRKGSPVALCVVVFFLLSTLDTSPSGTRKPAICFLSVEFLRAREVLGTQALENVPWRWHCLSAAGGLFVVCAQACCFMASYGVTMTRPSKAGVRLCMRLRAWPPGVSGDSRAVVVCCWL